MFAPLQCIGATTLDEYRKHIEKDPALERRFQPVLVPEPSVEETIQILKGLRERYEIHHKLRYTDEALVAAAQLSYQYIRSENTPQMKELLFSVVKDPAWLNLDSQTLLLLNLLWHIPIFSCGKLTNRPSSCWRVFGHSCKLELHTHMVR